MLGRPRPVLLLACIVAAPLLACAAFGATMIWPEGAMEDVPSHSHVACAAITQAIALDQSVPDLYRSYGVTP